VPVASSHILTSPTVASPSSIFPRTTSADDQNTADSGLPAAKCLESFWSPGLSPARLRALAADRDPVTPVGQALGLRERRFVPSRV